MARKRRVFSAPFKAKVAIEAIKGHRTINEIAAKHKLHATQINLWKKQLLEDAESIFENGSGKKVKPDQHGRAADGGTLRADRPTESSARVAQKKSGRAQ